MYYTMHVIGSTEFLELKNLIAITCLLVMGRTHQHLEPQSSQYNNMVSCLLHKNASNYILVAIQYMVIREPTAKAGGSIWVRIPVAAHDFFSLSSGTQM